MSIFEKLKNCNVLCQGSETLIALAPTNISTGFKAEFYKIKQKFVIEYAYLSVLYYAFLHKNKKREEKHMEKMILADKTELEKEVDGIKAQQVAQDGAILDLAGLVGGEV